MEPLLLALLGLGVGTIFFSDDDDAPVPVAVRDDDAFDEVDTPPEPRGEEIVVTDQTMVTGTDGADTIKAAGSTDLLDQLFAGDGDGDGDGDDLVELSGVNTTEIDGGPGDDRIATDAEASTILGEDGDDTLTGDYAQTLVFGGDGDGDGDDVINADQPFNSSSTPPAGVFTVVQEPSEISGEDGADTLNVDVCADPEVAAPLLSGGEGTDTFALDVTTTDFGFSQLDEKQLFEFDEFGNHVGEVETPIFQDEIARIADFEPGVDKLEIDLRDTHDETPGTHQLGSVTSDETETGTRLTITFDAPRPDDPDRDDQIVTTVLLEGVLDLDMDRDVTLIT